MTGGPHRRRTRDRCHDDDDGFTADVPRPGEDRSAATAHALDGVSLAPLLLRNEPPAERTLCWKAGDSWAVRQGAWKAIIQHRGPPELYHLGRDLSERRNLADTEPERLRDLLTAYAAWERQFP